MEINESSWKQLRKTVEEAQAEKICIIITKGEIVSYELPSGYTIKKVQDGEHRTDKLDGGQ